MILQPRIAFIPKNHSHSFCPKPITIPSLSNHEKLCPVKSMRTFLRKCNDMALSEEKDRPDFIWMTKEFTLLSTMKIHKIFQKLIYSADPNAYIRNTNIHSIRAIAASTLELKGLNFYSQPTLNTVLSAVVAGQCF